MSEENTIRKREHRITHTGYDWIMITAVMQIMFGWFRNMFFQF